MNRREFLSGVMVGIAAVVVGKRLLESRGVNAEFAQRLASALRDELRRSDLRRAGVGLPEKLVSGTWREP